MLLIIEITTVILSFLTLAYTGVRVGRSVAGFGRTAQRFQQQVEPKAARLTRQGETAQKLAFRVMERAEVLEQRVAILTISMERMMVLASAAAEARRKIGKVTGYIGL
ncbi:hypothetical protein BMS3Abin01_00495 [bacterium BMS3Abin01]|nr:hypothetical protein BMS3Abin01_00495 [bacterium BMS3Abin01]HDZ59726.1 hypothetical protein [Actinomycetota bacterium]